MSKGKKFRDIWLNQTRLGQRFGISAVAIGRKLRELGLRGEDNLPTPEAVESGYCRSAPLRDGTPFFLWHADMVAARLRHAGLTELSAQEQRCRELAGEYIEMQRLWDEGRDKLASLLWDELRPRLREVDIQMINHYLAEMGSGERLNWPLE
jgi:hypothetical protein